VKDSGEANLTGWSVYIDANNNLQFDAGEKQTLTDANGRYTFAGCRRELTSCGKSSGRAGRKSTGEPYGQHVTVSTGQAFGHGRFRGPSDERRVDCRCRVQRLNGNGTRDSTDTAFPAGRLHRHEQQPQTRSRRSVAVTDANGAYEFDNLSAGNYILRVILKSGIAQSFRSVVMGSTLP